MLRKGASSAPAKQSALFPSSCFPFLFSVAVAERAEPTISAIVLPLVLVDFLFSDFAPAPTATPSATSAPSRAIAAVSLGSSGCPRRLLVLGLRYWLGCQENASYDALPACMRPLPRRSDVQSENFGEHASALQPLAVTTTRRA